MYRYTKISVLAIAAAMTCAAAYGSAHANENDALAVVATKISITQAIAIAEQHVKGKAARAEYENTKQGWAYDVEVVSNGRVFDVRIDANKGKVLSSLEDQVDHDDEHDEND